MRVEVDIDQKLLDVYGTNTLLGTVFDKTRTLQGCIVVLKFHTSSAEYCQKNNGPRSLIMGDYVPMCLVEDILKLQGMGVEFQVEEVKEN